MQVPTTASSTSSLSSQSSPFRSDCLQGRTAIVTGGGSGIGYEIARQLLLHGCQAILICGRRQSFLDDAVRNLQKEIKSQQRHYPRDHRQQHDQQSVYGFKCDVRKPEQCQRAIQYFVEELRRQPSSNDPNHKSKTPPLLSSSSIDILVNGAAGNFLVNAEQLSSKGFETVLQIDAVGTFNMTTAAFPYLQQSKAMGGAVVINVSATLQYGATWYQLHASAAKSAVDSMTRSWALEWGEYGIRVNGIAPGPIANTPGTSKLAPTSQHSSTSKNDESTKNDLVTSRIPLGRMGTAEEIGHAVVYTCTAHYMTGTILVVDGGEWLHRGPPLVSRNQVADLSRSVEASSRAQRPTKAGSGTPKLQSML